MPSGKEFTVALTTWNKDGRELAAVRTLVFVDGQGVPAALETDPRDAEYVHAIARAPDGTAIGAGRLLPAVSGAAAIGRMAVHPDWRGAGVGAAMLKVLMDAARARGDAEIVLHAQLSAAPFYDRFGYERISAVYEEAGLAHVDMRRPL